MGFEEFFYSAEAGCRAHVYGVPGGYTKQMENGEPAAMHCLQSIYGLKQSSRLLHQRLSKFLKESGFKQLISDQCVYTKGAGNDQVIVALLLGR